MVNKLAFPEALREEMNQEESQSDFQKLLETAVSREFQRQKALEMDRVALAAMADRESHLTSLYTPDRAVTPGGTIKNNHMRSAWFHHAAHVGLENPVVLGYDFGRPADETATEEVISEAEEEVEDFLNRLGLHPYLWSTSEKLVVFAANPSEVQFLPSNTGTEHQLSASGLTFGLGADPGKIGKRLRAYAGAPGTFFDPRASTFPDLCIGRGIPFQVKVRDSGTVGDGGGACPRRVAEEIIKLSGAPTWGDIIAFQVVILGQDYSFKGLIIVVPDELWSHTGYDLVMDAKSVNHQVHSTKVTVGKLIPTRHHPNRRHFYVEPMNLGELVNRFVSADQLVEQVQVIAEKSDQDSWSKALQRSSDLRNEILGRLTTQDGGAEHHDPVQQAIRRQSQEKSGLLTAYEASLASPFGMPSLTSLVAGGLAKSWDRDLRNSRKGFGDEKPTLTGITVWGEKLLLMDPGYAGVTYPRRGYIRLIWHPRKENQLIAVGLSKADTLELRDFFDGMDVDGDKLQMIPITDERGSPMALLMRSPMSIDGGACLRLTLKDAELLREVGYHFYRKSGEHRYPGLHQVVDGEQVYPDVLHARPHENPPQWTTDPQLMVRRALEINQYRGIMGKVCLAAANLDFAGLYNPKKHKFNMSEEVIDPSLNASADPTPVLLPLQETILEAVSKGTPLDGCLFPRIRGGIRRMFQKKWPGEGFAPVLACPPHHHQWKKGQEGAIHFLQDQARNRELLAHGPAEWLTRRLRTKLYNIVVRAFEERTAVWAEKAQMERETRADETLRHRQQQAEIAHLIQQAKAEEERVIREAFQKAQRTVEDLETGQFIAAWMQAAISRAKRFRHLTPVRTGALLKLPPEELQGFFQEGESIPTAIIRTSETDDIPIQAGETCFVEEAEGRQNSYELVSSDGEIITDLMREARYYLGLELEFIGWLPKLRVNLRKGSTPWQQIQQRQMVLKVKNPQDM